MLKVQPAASEPAKHVYARGVVPALPHAGSAAQRETRRRHAQELDTCGQEIELKLTGNGICEDGTTTDTTPPPTPFNVKASPKGHQGTEVTWSAHAEFESGISGFIVTRDGQELAKVPEKPIGKFGRPLFQSMTYHDKPSQPMPEIVTLMPPRSQEKHTLTRSSP